MIRLHLRFLSGPREGETLDLGAPRVRIGRSRDNDLVLPEDVSPSSSSHHAQLIRKTGLWYLEDCESTNGTYLNGERVTRERLRNGDEIGFGGPSLLEAQTSLGPAPRNLGVAAVCLLALALFFGDTFRGGKGPDDFQSAAMSVGPSVFLVVAREDDGTRQVVGTAFAVEPGILATNAHVADAIDGGPALAVPNDSDGEARKISRVWLHPGYQKGSFRDDVALLELSPGAGLVPLVLAPRSSLETIRRGTPLASLGFPASATDPDRPRAMLRVTILGDSRGGRYLEIGEGVVPGTSGSPIFTKDGLVVGLVVGGDFTSHGGSERSGTISWGLSVRTLRELLQIRASSDERTNSPPARTPPDPQERGSAR